MYGLSLNPQFYHVCLLEWPGCNQLPATGVHSIASNYEIDVNWNLNTLYSHNYIDKFSEHHTTPCDWIDVIN